MHRRTFITATGLLALPPAWAHHGWSSFDQTRPIYLEGQAAAVKWGNPHAEVVLDLPADLKLPADLAMRALPAQSAGVDGLRCSRRPPCPPARTGAGRSNSRPSTAWRPGRCRPSSLVTQWRCWASPSLAKKAGPCCAPNTCSWAARPTACAPHRCDAAGLKQGQARKDAAAAAAVAATSSAVCAALTNPASYKAGAKYTPRCSMAWKKRLKRSLSVAMVPV